MNIFDDAKLYHFGFLRIVFESGLYVKTVNTEITSHLNKLKGNVPSTIALLTSFIYLQADCAILRTTSSPKNFEYVGIKNQ